MTVRYDKTSKDYVINGFERGIADDPYSGLGDMRNVQLTSVPKEASVNFSTQKISAPNVNGSLLNSSASGDTIVLDSFPESGSAIQFSVISDPTKGITTGTTYWVVNIGGGNWQLYSDYRVVSLVNITGDGLTGTYATVNMAKPKYFTYDGASYWMVDASGQVWSNKRGTSNSPFYWTFTGNKPNNGSNGNGLTYYQASDGTGYIFVFSNSSIDFTPTAVVSWTYQWNWLAGTAGSYNASPSIVLKSTNIHETLIAPDNAVYFCDGAYIGRWFENTNAVFSPTTFSTYTVDETRLLPFTDTAQCLTFLGTSVMIGGKNNVIYPWDTTSPTFSYPLLLPEYSIVKMVTVNTNTFIFVGNRGRIYYTNGTNAQLYKKIPDFISNTIEPYFTWGGACSNKNQLYFSASVSTNAGTALTTYGGVWAINLDTKAIRMTNTLSYQTTTFNGYAPTMTPQFLGNPTGTGLYIGWDSGSSTYGIDQTISNPYIGNTAVAQASIDSDLVPIGTFLQPTTNGRVEFKLSTALVAGESVQLFYRQKFADSFTAIGNAISTANSDFNGYSYAYQNVPFQNSQWIQIRAVLISTSSFPSYCRLSEIRLGN